MENADENVWGTCVKECLGITIVRTRVFIIFLPHWKWIRAKKYAKNVP